MARNKVECNHLMLHSGKVPNELKPADFEFLKQTQFSFIYGTEDEYLKKGIIQVEEERQKELFLENLEILTFKGGHEVNKEVIERLALS